MDEIDLEDDKKFSYVYNQDYIIDVAEKITCLLDNLDQRLIANIIFCVLKMIDLSVEYNDKFLEKITLSLVDYLDNKDKKLN